MRPLFNAKVTSKDGTMLLYIRGPYELPDGLGFEMKMFPVAEMGKWARIWMSEEVEDDAG